jgi:hypothetical protein
MDRKEKFRKLGHILAGIIILLHAYERFVKGESIALHLVAGIIFLLIAFLHHPLSKRFRWIDGIFYFIEAVVLFYTSYEYFHHGKKLLHFAYAFAGLGYLVATFIVTRKKMNTPAHH